VKGANESLLELRVAGNTDEVTVRVSVAGLKGGRRRKVESLEEPKEKK